jgi:hypothetical protein
MGAPPAEGTSPLARDPLFRARLSHHNCLRFFPSVTAETTRERSAFHLRWIRINDCLRSSAWGRLHRWWSATLRAFGWRAAGIRIYRPGPSLRLKLPLVIGQDSATGAPLRVARLFLFIPRLSYSGTGYAKDQCNYSDPHSLSSQIVTTDRSGQSSRTSLVPKFGDVRVSRSGSP